MPQMFTVDNIAKRLWGFLKCFASNETAQVKYEWEAMFGAEGQVKDSRWNQSMRLCCVLLPRECVVFECDAHILVWVLQLTKNT